MSFRNILFGLGSWLLAAHVSQATTITVTTTADAGAGSLRQAILDINDTNKTATGTSAAPHTIAFNIPSASLTGSFGSKRAVIALASPLPAITNSYVTIDGTTQTTTVGNTNTGTLGTSTTVGASSLVVAPVNRPEVELSLAASTTMTITTAVLTIQGTNCKVQGLAVHGAGSTATNVGGNTTGTADRSVGAGIRLDTSADGFAITQCIVGCTALSLAYPSDGTQCAFYGISIATGAGGGAINNSLIGYTGNSGIYIVNTGTKTVTISGCQFNQNGYSIAGGDAITLGASDATKASPVVIEGNLITSPSSSGVQLEVGATSTTSILNNTLLSCGLGGASANSLEGSAICYIQRNTTNTSTSSDVIKYNIIQNSKASGVVVGYNQQNVQITENRFSGNGTLSIDLNDKTSDVTTSGDNTYGNGDGVTPNRNKTATGSYTAVTNGGMDYPIFTAASLSGTTLTVAGYVGTATGQTTFDGATVEVYEAIAGTTTTTGSTTTYNNAGPVIAGDTKTEQHGELRRFLGSFTVANGTFSGSIANVTNLTKGDAIAGTAWLTGKGTSEAGTQYAIAVASTVTATDLTNATLQNTAARTDLSVSLTGSSSASGSSIASFTITSLPNASTGTLYYNSGTVASPSIAPVNVGLSIPYANRANLSFDPAAGYSGNAIAGYTATSDTGVTSDDNATITIPINNPPTANNVTNKASIANTTTTTTAIDALSGTDSDGTVSTFTITSLPTSGKLYYNTGTLASPSYTQITTTGYSIAFARASYLGYVPASGFVGKAVLAYTATDNSGGVSAAASYTIPVSGTGTASSNQAPSATNVVNPSMPADAGITSLSSLAGTDPDGNATIAGFTIKTLPASGTLYFNGAVASVGTVVLANQANLLSYKPTKAGDDTFTYSATDNQDLESASPYATFRIPVAAPLPVVLVRFEAQRTGTAATLTWATASEKNSDYFAIERSLDGTAFAELGRVASNGTTQLSHSYQFVDAEAARANAPVVYYRLRQVDLDGTATYSAVRSVAFSLASLTVQAYPVPARGTSVQLVVSAPTAGAAAFVVTNALGQALLARQVALAAGTTSLALPEAAQWPRGVYVLYLTQGQAHHTLKLVCE